jgi:hypothetical protein
LHFEDDNIFFARRGRFLKEIRIASNFECDRLIVRVLDWNGNLELSTRQALGADQGHSGGRFYVRRYENNFYSVFDKGGFHWKDIAAFSECWFMCVDSWLLARQKPKSQLFVKVDRTYLQNLRSIAAHKGLQFS